MDNEAKALGLLVVMGVLVTYAIWFGVEGYSNASLVLYIASMYCMVHAVRFFLRRNR